MAWDVFISYRHLRKSEVLDFCRLLEASGITYFRDEERREDEPLIQRGIERGLGDCRLLLAWFDPTYLESQACTWELGRALIAGRRRGHSFEVALQRIVCIDPSGTFAHIPEEIWNDARPLDPKDPEACVEYIRQRLAGIAGTFGHVPADGTGNWYERECPRHPHWVGREPELLRIYGGLCRGELAMKGDERAPIAIVGHGGEGKTMLAEMYAIRQAAAYPGGVVWLRGMLDDGPPEESDWLEHLERELAQVAASAKLKIPRPKVDAALQGIEEPRGRVRALKQLIEDRLEGGLDPGTKELAGAYLWVVDDLPSLGADDALLWLPSSSEVHCLVTTRGLMASGTFRAIELRLLAAAQAWRILTRRRTPRGEAEERAARQIVEMLGRLPLALELMSSAAEDADYTALLEQLQLPLDEGLEPLFEELKGALPTQHASSIVKTFDRSLDLLEGADDLGTRSKGEAAWTLLRAAALLSPAPLPDVLAIAIHRAMGFPAGWFAAVVARARRAALLQRPTATGRPYSQMHALLARTVCETRISKAQEAALRTAIARAVSTWLADEIAREAGHVDGRIFAASTPLLRGDDSLGSADAAHALGEFAYGLGRWQDALLLHEHALKVRRRLLGLGHDATVDALEGLAAARLSQGDIRRARSNLEEVLSLRLAQNGSTHPHTLRATGRLALALHMLGDTESAREQLHWAWQVWQYVDPSAREALGCATNLALCIEALGDVEGARELHSEAYRRKLQLLPVGDPDTLDSLQHLALVDLRLGDVQSAESRFRAVRKAQRLRAGPRSPETLSAMHNLALAWRQGGRLRAACVLLKKTVDGLRATWGQRHPATMSAMHGWAEALLASGNADAAVELLETVTAIRRDELGNDHPNTRNSTVLLAQAYRAQGRVDRAIALEALDDQG